MKYSLKLTGILFFFLMMFSDLHAQQKHFIYIQSEDKQPFAVVLSGKVYSSSDDGYVIVPKLTDGSYDLTVSFPLNKYPEQSFKCVINKKDLGYTLQNLPEKGWALQNIQTQKILPNNNSDVAANGAFSVMLSEVVSDSNLTKKDVVSAPSSPDNSNALAETAIAGSLIVASTDSTKNVGVVTDSIGQLEKISESQLDTGTNMVFVDKTGGGSDTISVFVPADSANNPSPGKVAAAATTGSLAIQQQTNVASPVADNEMTKQNAATNETSSLADTNSSTTNPFYKPDSNAKLETAAAGTAVIASQSDQTAKTVQVTNAYKEDCHMISDNDFDKMKRKMFVENNNNSMIQAAVRSLGSKCLTTEQVKMLGNLFSSDDGRYNLFDALYNNVYDYGNYPLLESQILDPYYKKRFEVMLR